MEALGGPDREPPAMVKPAYRPPELAVATKRPAATPGNEPVRDLPGLLWLLTRRPDQPHYHTYHACRRRPQLGGFDRQSISRQLVAAVYGSAAERYGVLARFRWGEMESGEEWRAAVRAQIGRPLGGGWDRPAGCMYK